jgi:very-short-patch-repair endonuclease
MALHARLLQAAELEAAIAARGGTRNVARLRRMVGLVEPASVSPMETRLRLQLVLAGLPRPQVQVDLHDRRGRFIGRADLYYPSHRLWIEYDGGTHRQTLVADNRRQNQIQAAGYLILRFTAPDLLYHPGSVVSQVRAVLSGPPKPTFGDS